MRHEGIVAGSIRLTPAHVPAAVQSEENGDGVFVSHGRSRGLLTRLTLAAVAVAAMVMTVAVAATLLVVVLASALAAILVRALRLKSSSRRTVSTAAPWSGDTIETTLVRVNPQTRDSYASTTPDLVVQDTRQQ